MTSIDRMQAVLLVVQAKLKERNSAAHLSKTPAPASSEPLQKPKSRTNLDEIRAIGKTATPETQRLATRVFVESILTDELGSQLTNLAEFQTVVDRVTDALYEDDTLRGALAQLLE